MTARTIADVEVIRRRTSGNVRLVAAIGPTVKGLFLVCQVVPAVPRPRGLSCPKCGAVGFQALYSKYPAPGVKIRYFSCRECGERIKTREVLVTSFQSKTHGVEARKVRTFADRLGGK